MQCKHIFLALLVVVIWGCNFVFIKFGVSEISPLFLCAIRFFLASVPAIFFIKPPAAPIKIIIIYGLLMFGLQFSFLFLGIKAGIMPGLASLLVQVQVFFSIFFAALFLKETPSAWQIAGGIVSFSGIGLIAIQSHNTATLTGFLLIIGACMWWGLGNLITKQIRHVNMIALVVWGSFVACLPLLLCSLLFEGPKQILSSVHHITWLGVGSVVYIVYASTWVGYGVWNKLISHYPIATVVPFTLLVPIFGLLSSAFVFDEPLQSWKIIAGILVVSGLCINILSARLGLKQA
ncbi:MAG: EamA family transporter [Gammaproteobacteria bacterium]|nr:EamA family transporter [Gammaproteobacteria bacterium]